MTSLASRGFEMPSLDNPQQVTAVGTVPHPIFPSEDMLGAGEQPVTL